MLSVHLSMLLLGILFGVLHADLGTSTPPSGSCLCLAGSGVRIRNAAGLSGGIIGMASTGECYKYTGQNVFRDNFSWYSISYNGKAGWAAGKFLKVGSASSCSSTGVCGAGGAFNQGCIDCICEVESRCRPLDCKWDVNSLSCGYFQIKEPYYNDCYKPGSGWKSCSKDKACATTCVKRYMDRYYTRCTSSATQCCEQAARIHNGGPMGCSRSATLPYWNKVKECLIRKNIL